MQLNPSDIDRLEFVRRHTRLIAQSAADSIDQSLDELLALRTPEQRRALGSVLCVLRWQFIKLGIRFTDNELAAALGIPLLTLRRIMPSRQEQARALRQSGISLKEATHLMHLHPATLNRLAAS